MGKKSIVWIPPAGEKDTSVADIIRIHLVAYKPQDESFTETPTSTTKKTNHWSISLQIGTDTSVTLDPSPNHPDMDMTLGCSAKSYNLTVNAHKIVALTPKKPTTVGDFMELLKLNKYDKYKFTPSGNGCRYWVYCVVELLQKSGVLDDLSLKGAATAIDAVWENNEHVQAAQQTSCNDRQGTFVG